MQLNLLWENQELNNIKAHTEVINSRSILFDQATKALWPNLVNVDS